MDVMSARCPSCGAPVNVNQTVGKHLTCNYCTNDMVIKNAIDYAANYSDSDQISNTRTLLDQAINANDIEEITKHSSIILSLVPSDYTAIYYYAYAQAQKGITKYITNFYETAPDNYTVDELQRISGHIIEYSELKDNQKVINYIAGLPINNVSELLERYDKSFNKRYVNEQNYDIIPRDVFICHQSSDKKQALEIVKTLESDGNSCWISYRNLRPNDSQNYWQTIEQAINHCRLFLVVTSRQAMLSNDVKREMQIAKSGDKIRIEYVIEDISRTTFFKDFFDGSKWISAVDDPNSLEILKIRINDELNQIKDDSTVESNPSHSGNFNQTISKELTQRAKLLIENQKYSEAKALLDNALMYNSKNGKAYIGLLLIEAKMPNIESLINSDRVIEDSDNYQNAIKFSDENDRYQLKRINETIIAQIESQNKEQLYSNAMRSLDNAKTREQLSALKDIFVRLGNFNDSENVVSFINEKLEFNRENTFDAKSVTTPQRNGFKILIVFWVFVFFLIPYGWAFVISGGLIGYEIVQRKNFSQNQFILLMVLYFISLLINFFGWLFEF